MTILSSNETTPQFIKRSYSHPLPERRLLAAVLVQAVRDVTNDRTTLYDQRTARLFLIDREGQALLEAFGIPEQKVQALVRQIILPAE
jgi:hypothetical protein